MARVHPQDTVDVPLAARRNAAYDCEFVLNVGRSSMDRLAAVVDNLIAVDAQFELSMDDYGRPRIVGQAKACVVMPCQRCLEEVQTDVTATLEQVIWFGEELPVELATSELDVMLSSTKEMTFAALVEDDLLLALPQQVCQVEDCERLPVLAYPAPGYTSQSGVTAGSVGDQDGNQEDSLPDDRQRPFAGLKDLLKSQELKGQEEEG